MVRPKKKRIQPASSTAKKEQALTNSRKWDDYEVALHKVKDMWGAGEDYHNWHNDIYDRFRESDHECYEQEIWVKYFEFQPFILVKGDRCYGCLLVVYEIHHSSDLCKTCHEELQMLRKIHGDRWLCDEDELETLRRVHDKWKHPAKSDLSKYAKEEIYWEGDKR